MWRTIDKLALLNADLAAQTSVGTSNSTPRNQDRGLFFEKKLLVDDIIFEWDTSPSITKAISSHARNTNTFIFLRRGAFVVAAPGHEQVRRTVGMLPPGSQEISFEEGSECVSVTIPTAILQKRLSSLMGRPAEKQVEFVQFPDADSEQIRALCQQIFVLPSTPILVTSHLLGARNESLVNLIVDCFLLLFPNNFSGAFAEALPRIAPKHVKRALDYIHSNPHRHVEPQVLADLSSVSKRTLQYSFQSVTGQTISDYQRLLRLRRAHAMVTTSPEISIKEIADLWGFGSQAAFGQSFKRAFGLSPSEARRNQDGKGPSD